MLFFVGYDFSAGGADIEGDAAGLAIALIFVILGDVNAVAGIITMFFMVTYGTICLISFLHHFGADPSYRPSFRSRWYISLAGFLISMILMIKIDPLYSVFAFIFIIPSSLQYRFQCAKLVGGLPDDGLKTAGR